MLLASRFDLYFVIVPRFGQPHDEQVVGPFSVLDVRKGLPGPGTYRTPCSRTAVVAPYGACTAASTSTSGGDPHCQHESHGVWPLVTMAAVTRIADV